MWRSIYITTIIVTFVVSLISQTIKELWSEGISLKRVFTCTLEEPHLLLLLEVILYCCEIVEENSSGNNKDIGLKVSVACIYFRGYEREFTEIFFIYCRFSKS